METAQNKPDELRYVGLNLDYGCFSCATKAGFRIYNCEPFKEIFRRDFLHGGIKIVEMLFRSNIMAFVGADSNNQYPPNKVIIWDDHLVRAVGELSFRADVKAVKLRSNKVIVVLEYKIYVYNLPDLKLIEQIDTISNPRGICAVCPSSTNFILACPDLKKGQVRVGGTGNKPLTISAHENALSCVSMNNSGTRLATASEKGTLIRVWNTSSGELLHELRRGKDKAEIYSISFNHNCAWLVVSSDKGTAHIFSLAANDNENIVPQPLPLTRADEGNQNASNPKSNLSFLQGISKYFGSEWSFAQFHVHQQKMLISFGPEQNTIIAIGLDGSFYKCSFDPIKGGECIQKERYYFLNRT